MAEVLAKTGPSPTADDGLPRVRLELRHSAAKPATYEVADASFLVGSIPGCDLRLPGLALPPVVCVLARQADGVVLRKLAPTVPLQVNGRTISLTTLANGDRLTIGTVELIAHIEEVLRSAGTETSDLARQLEMRQKQIEDQARELETDRVIWYRRREEIEKEIRQQREAAAASAEHLEGAELSKAHADLEQREEAIERERDRLAQLQRELATREEATTRQRQEQDGVRQELTTIRQQLYDRYRERRDRLAGLQEAVNKAARKVQERKQDVDAQAAQAAATRAEQEARQTEQEARAAELAAWQRNLQDEGERWKKHCETKEQEVAARQAEFQAEQHHLTKQREALQQGQTQHQTDLVRLDRREAELEEYSKRIQEREQEINRRSEQLQHDTLDLEEQARQLDEWHTKLRTEADRLAQQNAEMEPQRMELAQRAAAMEGQQTMLATLRSRLERLREETRHEAQQLAEQRARQESTELDLHERQEESERLRAELDAERQTLEQEKRRYEERGAALETAVARARELQDALAKREAELRQQTLDADAKAAELTEQDAVLQVRSAQVAELQQRVEADRRALKEREADLARAEQVRAALQEQLHRRSEELAARQRLLTEQARRQGEGAAGFQAQVTELQRDRQQLEERLAARSKELEAQQAALEGWNQKLEMSRQKLQEMGRTIAAERKAVAEDRGRHEGEQRAVEQVVEQSRSAIAITRQEAMALHQQLPELEQRAVEAVERLGQSRDRLREHLAELHAYARQGQEDLEALRTLVRTEADQVHEQALALHRAKNEHRLAVAAFRQHIIDWQGQIVEMKRALSQGETRLERRRAEVDEQARQVDANSVRLAQQAQVLEEEQRQVAVRRGEMERHLADMREWYRRKLRELAVGKEHAEGEEVPAQPMASDPETVAAATGNGRNILALTGDLEPGDRQLGDLLRSLELVDADTLNALLVEARRQRRSLRQVLLAGNYLTLYQLALIEAGNLDGLVLGPTRVVDRVRVTSREAVYRVFDPRRGREAMLRHLAEAEAQDAVRPDEFRQRFAAAAVVQHPHLAATLEVLDIAGRPAVLQECLAGLSSRDWPALAAVPGVWYRLLSQAALGLHTAHQAGLIHGHLRPESALLTAEGVLKVRGFGEPIWLVEPPEPDDENASHGPITDDVAGDLTALGSVAGEWVSASRRKGSRAKPLPASLQDILRRLGPDAGAERFATAAALLEALDHAGADVPPNAEAWDRLVHHVRDHRQESSPLRQSA